MTTLEFRDKYHKYDKLILKPKPGLERVKIGYYEIPVNQDKYRAFVEDDTIFIYGKGKSRKGYRAKNDEQILSQFDIVTEDKNAKWQKRIARAIKAMESSGLWPGILETMKNLKKMTYEDRKAIYDLTWSSGYREFVYDDSLSVDEYNEKFIKIFGTYMEKYPFIFFKTDNGKWNYHTDYLYEMSGCELKSMYFGKYRNAEYKDEIQNAIKSKEAINRSARTSYDVSFSYDPDKNMAWYKEEYKNCGNGHYYIALDHNLALFCEND